MNGPANMVTLNNATGGPVGGPQQMMMQAQQQAGQQQQPQPGQDPLIQLNTYIYDHLLKYKHYDLARNFINVCQINRREGKGSAQQNGVDPMDTDSKDSLKKPDDLPEPATPPHPSEESFLLEWWGMFWDVFGAAHKKAGTNSAAQEYYMHTVNQQKVRQKHQGNLVNGFPNQMMLGMNQMNMAKQAMQRNANPNIMQQKMMASQMQRDPSNMDMQGGQRPQTPGESAGSPSKRQRSDGGFEGQAMGPGGRPMPNQLMGNNGQLMLQNGMNEMTQQQMSAFHAGQTGQPKMEGINGLPQPMGQQMDGMEQYATNGRMIPNGTTGDGRHALQDYQMQLMLLEQQNKKRLLQARREQDHIIQVPGAQNSGPPGSGQPGQAFAPNMSPSGSRGGGPSPNPSEQMKRISGTPKMAQQGMPGSPMPDMQNRGSPAPNFDPSNGQMPQGMPQQFYGNMAGNVMARPPSSHPQFQMNPQQLENMRMASGGRLPNGSPWPPGHQPMMQPNPANQQPQQGMPTPQQRHSNMPPPPAPAPEQQQRTQPSSPAQPAAPPTPSQQPKAGPKGKKEAAAQKKKNAPKKTAAATAATPAAESAEPPTPTPSTPITPMHNQFNKQNGGANQTANANSQQAQAQSSTSQVPQPGMDGNAGGAPFTTIGGDDTNGFNLDFAGIDSNDVLESFDFDSFLHTDDTGGFGGGADFMNFGNADAIEAGAGDV